MIVWGSSIDIGRCLVKVEWVVKKKCEFISIDDDDEVDEINC